MQRQITEKIVQKAQDIYAAESKPLVDKILDFYNNQLPKTLVTDREVKMIFEETEEIKILKKRLEEIVNKIKNDLYSGNYLHC
jgi:hypothetical protein